MAAPTLKLKTSGTALSPQNVTLGSAAGDAFGRLRTSYPHTIFDSKQLYDNQPLFWDDAEESGAGTSSSHSTDTASTTIGVSASTAGKRTRQTFMRFNYQPGKSQLVMMTFVLDKTGGGTDVVRMVGLGDDDNGVFLVDDEGTYKFRRRTYASGAAVDNDVAQSSWDDPMDGTGASKVTVDFSKSQILAIDLEWLGVGSVRFWFVIDGVFHLAHTMNHANSLSVVYMSTPNLPLRYQIEATGAGGAASTLEHICCTVISEGGFQELGAVRSASTDNSPVTCTSEGTAYAILGIRLKSAYIGCTVKLSSLSFQIQSASEAGEWLLLFNPTVGGTFTYSGESNSCVEVARGATTNTVTSGTRIAAGYGQSSTAPGGGSGGGNRELDNAILLGSAIDGTVDEIVLAWKPLSGTNQELEGSLTWREIS